MLLYKQLLLMTFGTALILRIRKEDVSSVLLYSPSVFLKKLKEKQNDIRTG